MAIDPHKELARYVARAGTQVEAAKRLGVSQPYLSDILRGRRMLSRNMLTKLGLTRVETIKRAS